jgi:hypothetical protein
MTLLVFFLINYFIAINAFDPVSLPTSSSPNSATHEAITRCAVATVTIEYIQQHFGINTPIPTITNGICPSSFFTQVQTVFSQIASQGGSTYFNWKVTLDYIVARNAIVDVNEQTNAPSHFDSESFIAGSQLILQRYQSAVSALNSLDYENANEFFGKMSHTLQGIYHKTYFFRLLYMYELFRFLLTFKLDRII